jgi:hypothetical protein
MSDDPYKAPQRSGAAQRRRLKSYHWAAIAVVVCIVIRIVREAVLGLPREWW